MIPAALASAAGIVTLEREADADLELPLDVGAATLPECR